MQKNRSFGRKLIEVAVCGALLLAITAPITKTVWSQAAPIRAEVSAGVYENLKSDGFGKLYISSAYATPALSANCTVSAVTVTSTSQSLISANSARRALMIQNNSFTTPGVAYFNFGATATTAHMRLDTGDSVNFSAVVPTQAVHMIGSIASNTAITAMECQ